jgi:predicted transcriptional regulator
MTDTIAMPPVPPKKIVRDALDRMPENLTLPQILDELALVAALKESMEDYEQGRLIPHAEVMARAKRWLSK